MKWLSAGLIFVNFATVCGLLLGFILGHLHQSIALASLMLGVAAALAAFLYTADPVDKTLSGHEVARVSYRSIWLWVLAACFTIFAVRSFCWLLFIEGEQLRIQSPNNLGDLALHITYIKNFANGVSLWPDNPIYAFSKLRYPVGIDLFNALLSLQQVDLIRGLVWVGLLASLATFYAFYRWGGAFGVAGFLFNGGFVGFQFFATGKFMDYQGDNMVVWKSIPLAMFVTQRGLLYAIPAGLLLLWHWRQKFFRAAQDQPRAGLPFWVELSLYASMPLFHLHTFIALSVVLVSLFIFGDAFTRIRLALLGGSALIPATFFVWLITEHFHAGSIIDWQPGLLLHSWLINFGLWIPLVIILIGFGLWHALNRTESEKNKLSENLQFLLPAVVIFLISVSVKLAAWEWDNLKVLIWAYFIVLPFLWSDLISRWISPARVVTCLLLFTSGFVSLFGGLAAGREGYSFANRGEVDAVGIAVRSLPVEARFAAFPTYNHPLLLQGRKVVLGFTGHLWSQGFDYKRDQQQLTELMEGVDNWRAIARHFGVRYIFWGREEQINYPASTRPWEQTTQKINYGNWGAIYDLESPNPAPVANSPR